jgi:CheY-like chemotaxis protein
MLVEMESTFQNPVKTILLVDDDLHFVKLIKSILCEEGYTVYCGFDGNMAVDLAKKHHPDLIMMDINMPYMDGLKAFRHLRSMDQTSRIPVIFVSEVISQIIHPVLDSAPRASHLKKPLDLVDLTSLTRQLIQLYAA